MSKKISVKQFLMKTGKFERVYDCVQEIRSGKVLVNSRIIKNPNYFFNPKNAVVRFYDEKVRPVGKIYFLLNKPAGYLSQKSEHESTVYDILKKSITDKKIINSVFAVGRLDKDTEGLMIMTNDGKLSNTIMEPEKGIIKKYYAVLENPVDAAKIKMMERGMEIGIGEEKSMTSPCKIKIAGEKEVYISVSEGKKRQIRKMAEAAGNKIVYLKRVSIGGLQLGSLKSGEIMEISREEILEKLFQ